MLFYASRIYSGAALNGCGDFRENYNVCYLIKYLFDDFIDGDDVFCL